MDTVQTSVSSYRVPKGSAVMTGQWQALPRPQSSDSYSSAPIQGQVQFGKGPKGFSTKIFGLKNNENKRVMWGYLLRYGSPFAAIGLSFLSGPLACCVLPLSAIGLWIAEKQGSKLLESVNKRKMSGLPKNVEHIRQIWENTGEKEIKRKGAKPYNELRTHYNEIIDTFFKQQKGIRNRLRLHPKSRLNKLVERAFYVQALYRKKPAGRFVSWLRRLAAKPPFRFPLFRYPLTAFSWLLQAVMTLLYSRRAAQLIKKVAK